MKFKGVYEDWWKNLIGGDGTCGWIFLPTCLGHKLTDSLNWSVNWGGESKIYKFN
jgi:hypothetical protein